MKKRGLITKEVRLRRIDNALEKRQLQLARWLAKPLDQSAKQHVNAWAQARRHPEKFLTKQAEKFPKWTDMAASRLARKNPDRLLKLIKDRKIPEAVRQQAILGAARTMAIKSTLPPHHFCVWIYHRIQFSTTGEFAISFIINNGLMSYRQSPSAT